MQPKLEVSQNASYINVVICVYKSVPQSISQTRINMTGTFLVFSLPVGWKTFICESQFIIKFYIRGGQTRNWQGLTD